MAKGISSRRLFSLLVAIAGFLVFLPGLRSPYWLDDYAHRAMVNGAYPSVHPRSPFDLYNFVTDEDRSLLIDRGVLPWWSHPHLTVRFFRPLSSVLRWLDFKLSDSAALHHVHSFFWWAFAVACAASLFRRWLRPRGVVMATIIFALAPCHAIPLSWLANREALVSLAFGTLGFAAMLRVRESGKWRDGLLALAMFSVATLGGEYVVAFSGYVIAFEMFVPAPFKRRVASVLSFAIPMGAMLAVRFIFGFGTSGSGFYRDPFHQTGTFLFGMPRRLGRLLVDAWLSSEANWAMDLRPWVLAALIFVVALALYFPIRRALAAEPNDDARRVRIALLAGSTIGLMPMVAVLPAPRLVGASMIGIATIIAMVLDHGWFPDPLPETPRADLVSVVVLLLGFFHLVHGPVTALLMTRDFAADADDVAARMAWLRERVDDQTPTAEIAVARADWHTVLFAPFALDPSGQLPKHWWVLSFAPHALMLRVSDRTIDIIVPKGRGYFPTGPNDLFRSEDSPLHTGDEVQVPGLHATVLEGGDLGPGRVRFDFDEKLESLVWIETGRDGWRDASPPRLRFGAPLDP